MSGSKEHERRNREHGGCAESEWHCEKSARAIDLPRPKSEFSNKQAKCTCKTTFLRVWEVERRLFLKRID